MKIELVGTGAIYSKYNSASTLINEDMMVDFPNGVLKQLLKSNHEPEKINKILITHMHGDHTADIPFIMLYKYKHKKMEENTYIIGPIGIENKVKQLMATYNFYISDGMGKYMKFIELGQNEILENEEIGYKIQSFPVVHGEEKPTYGYIINNKLGVTGDSALCEGVQDIVKNSEAIIADCSKIQGNDAHMGIDNLSFLAQTYGKKIFATHMRDETREELINLKIPNILVEEDRHRFEL